MKGSEGSVEKASWEEGCIIEICALGRFQGLSWEKSETWCIFPSHVCAQLELKIRKGTQVELIAILHRVSKSCHDSYGKVNKYGGTTDDTP